MSHKIVNNSAGINGSAINAAALRATMAFAAPGRSAQKMVLVALAAHADADHCATVSVRQIMQATALSHRGVNFLIRGLERGGWVETTPTSTPTRGSGPNRYHLPFLPRALRYAHLLRDHDPDGSRTESARQMFMAGETR